MTTRRRFPAIASVPVVFELQAVQLPLGLACPPLHRKRRRRGNASFSPTPIIGSRAA